MSANRHAVGVSSSLTRNQITHRQLQVTLVRCQRAEARIVISERGVREYLASLVQMRGRRTFLPPACELLVDNRVDQAMLDVTTIG